MKQVQCGFKGFAEGPAEDSTPAWATGKLAHKPLTGCGRVCSDLGVVILG